MGNRQVAGRCAQNSAVPLICPLDIQGACESSVFGDIIKKTEATSNTGLLNFNWKAQLEGSSLLLGLFLVESDTWQPTSTPAHDPGLPHCTSSPSSTTSTSYVSSGQLHPPTSAPADGHGSSPPPL